MEFYHQFSLYLLYWMSGKSLHDLIKDIKLWPQKSQNIIVSKEKKATWDSNEELMNFIGEKEKEINKKRKGFGKSLWNRTSYKSNGRSRNA